MDVCLLCMVVSITSVVRGLSVRWFSSIHQLSVVGEPPVAQSVCDMHVLMCRRQTFRIIEIYEGKDHWCRQNRRGPKTEPCGTPNFVTMESDLWSLTATLCVLFQRRDLEKTRWVAKLVKLYFLVRWADDDQLNQKHFPKSTECLWCNDYRFSCLTTVLPYMSVLCGNSVWV